MERGEPIDEDFLCPVCMSILLEPTTLNCGHSVCRGCLAGWYLSARPRRRECPTCRQIWEGYLQVNTTLRNIIERQHGDRVAERRREREENDDDYRTKLRNFEDELWRFTAPARAPGNGNPWTVAFWSGVGVAVLAVLVIFILWPLCITGSSDKSKTEMPVALWKPGEVASWLNSLGWARNYSEFAEHYVVDGRALLNMETLKLMELLNVTDQYHQYAFLLAVESLRESGVSMPQTLWEYKALYPGRTMYLTFGMNKAPRSVMLYLYLFHYEELFIPFLHITVPRQWEEEFQFSRKLPSPSVSQFLMFLLMMLVFPYGMVGLFAWSLRSVHTVTHLVVITSCFFKTVLELNFLSDWLQQGRWRSVWAWKVFFKTHLITMAWLGVFYACWSIIPSFVGSFVVYMILYFTPFTLLKDMNTIIVEGRQR